MGQRKRTRKADMNEENSQTKRKSGGDVDATVVQEFGGSIGVTFMMGFFPLLMYYLWICVEFYDGALARPSSLSDIVPFSKRLYQHFLERAAPNLYGTAIYGIFALFEAVLAIIMPGPVVKGLPIPSEGNRQLSYTCNGVACWYTTLIVSLALHVSGVFRLTEIVDNFGHIMTAAIIFGFVVSFLTYFLTILFGKPHRMSGSFAYDLFMGAPLNPRLGNLDLKMWAEIRIPWIILFYVSLSAAIKQYEVHGVVSSPIIFMVLAHLLYVNACMKGEECIPTTWDIFYEKWGFMLIFWNFAGVPFTYCLSSLYLLKQGPFEHSVPYTATCFVVLLLAYYVWDTANSQKNRFRMSLQKTYIPRSTFPQLPWGTLTNPSYIKTKQGSYLLTSGWYAYARKIHYTADLVMAFLWGAICGFSSVLPFFYFVFFFFVLVHRCSRDMERCARKYGEDWDAYCKKVPYIFVPGIF